MSDLTLATGIGGAVLIAGLLLTGLWRLFLARRVWLTGAERKLSKVSAYQLALMNDGASRVALTAVVRLVGRKALTPDVAGVLVKPGNFHGELDPYEREAVALAPAVLPDLLAELERQLERKGLIAALRHDLIGMGYMRAFASWHWWVALAQNMLPLVLMIAMALWLWIQAKLAIAADRDWLLEIAAAGCAATLIASWPTPVTAFGRYIIWSATQHHPDYKTARAREGESLDAKKLGQAVALYGRDALAGSDLAWISAILKHAENSGHSD